MAAAIKYLGSFLNRYGKNVIISILADGSFTPIPISFAESPVTITYDGEDEDIYQTMIPSKASINLMVGEDDADLFEDINNMTENTFGVLIVIREPDFPFNLLYKWEGWLVPDEQVRKFTYQDQPMTLTAIDPISRAKGQKLLNSDGSYIYGRQTMQFIVDRCLQDVFTPDTSLATYNLIIDSDLTLSNTTTTTLPPLLEQLQINAEAFNDDLGKPKSGYDVIEMIAKALFMRVFYENGNIYMIDILQYSLISASPSISLNTFFYQNEFTTEGTNTLLIGNTENITRTRTFRDSICKFKYNSSIGLLHDGNLINWTPISGGFKLTEWYYSPYLAARSDVYNRRQGTGRVESPFGMLIRYTAEPVDAFDAEDRFFDVIATKSVAQSFEGEIYTLNLVVSVPNSVNVQGFIPYMDGNVPLVIPYWVIAFNESNPSQSYMLDSSKWNIVDLSGTDYELSGTPDWINTFGDYDNSLNGSTPDSMLHRPLTDLELESTPYSLFAVARTIKNQEFTREFPPLPSSFKGIFHVLIHPAINDNSDLYSKSALPNANITNTIVYSALLSQKTNDVNGVGEIQYLSRKIVTSKDNVTREIDFNTTVNRSVSGAISNAVDFDETSGTIVAGTNLTTISLIGAPEPLYSGVSLMEYNAIMQMWLNFAQYKIDVETIGNRNLFYDAISMAQFYDATKPSTDIYNSVFIQTKSSWKLKEATRTATIISIKDAKRDITRPPDGVLDDTHDFSEFYYMK